MMNMPYHKRFWNQLKELKVHYYYVQNYAASQNRYDQVINILLAITSSTSIAVWALRPEYDFICACILAASQVIVAVKPLFPYKKRMEALNTLGESLSQLSLSAERDWYFISESIWSDEEIHNKWTTLKSKALAVEKKALSGLALPKNDSALAVAEKEADSYLKSTYYS
ncbi:MAG: hypothetical protein GQ475_00260 [Methylococcaceae bacterium]|nr:hypothetical protein [Methylococcaceae bacterium]